MRRLVLLALAVLPGCMKTLDYVELRPEQKIARLMKLEDERSLGGGEIATRLADDSSPIRRRAALSLGRIGDPAGAAPLAALLADPEAAVRATAAFALGLIEGPLAPDVADALRAALADSEAEVRGRAAWALGRKSSLEDAARIADAARKHLPSEPPPHDWGEDLTALSPRLPHPDLRFGLFALARLGSVDWARALLFTEDAQPRFSWWPAAWTAARLASADFASLYLYYAEANEPYLRVLAARGLGSLEVDGIPRALIGMLRDTNEKVRIAAAQAVASLRLAEAVPELLARMEGDTAAVQVVAIEALASIPDERALDPLIDRLNDGDPWIRAAVLRALAFQDLPSFWLLLSGLDPDPDWRVRAALARLLGEIGDRGAIGLLRDVYVEDRDYRVRPHALEAIAKADPSGAVPILIAHLSAEDPFERAAAARTLGAIGAAEAIEPLRAAWEAAASDREPDARRAILAALAGHGAEVVEPLARRALDDPSWIVRREAQALLNELGDTTARAAGPRSDRTLYDYIDLLSPEYSPHAFIRTEKGAIEVELFVIDAPLTVNHFIRLARSGFYNGLTFHRVVPNYVVQGGDPRGDSNGGPGYAIRCEINMRPYLRGTVGMALDGKDTGGSQFFITQLPQPQLEGDYTAFGQVVAGMDVVDRLEPGDLIREIVIWDGRTMGDHGGRAGAAADR